MLERFNLFVVVTALLLGANVVLAQSDSEVAPAEPDHRFVLATVRGDFAQGRLGYVGLSEKLAGVMNPTLRVEVGDVVEIVLINGDGGTHNWVVDELALATELIQREAGLGSTTSIVFTAGEEGEFTYYCSVGRHAESGMIGRLVVDPVSEDGQ